MIPLRSLLSAFLLVGLAASSVLAREGAGAAERHQLEAQALVADALARLEKGGVEERRIAIADLERATILVPGNPEYELQLARAYYRAGFAKAAYKRYERVAALRPDDAEARFGLAQVWRRDWLKYLDSTSIVRAVDHLREAVKLDTSYADAWLMLSSLLVERGDPRAAQAAAERACVAEPGRPECLLALGATRWRMGDVEGAGRAFGLSLPRLRRSVRERFDDIAPLANEADTALYNHLEPGARLEYERRFWKEQDPDLTTPENEAQLEYWARVTQAYFLFYDPRHREWDERGEIYVRYGPPERSDYNPVGMSLSQSVSPHSVIRYPMNVLVWSYPSLGMTVTMQDRVLSSYYQLPVSYDEDPDPRPDPDSLARLDGLSTHDSRGVFPSRPPRTQAVPVEWQVARFPAAQGARMFAALAVAGSPADSLAAEFVVLDSTENEVARGRRSLSPSACDAERRRVADFASDLPPGRYRVGLGVRSGERRGSARIAVTIAPPDSQLVVSDIAVTCGSTPTFGSAVRLDANPGARIRAGEPLTAYFEIHHLVPGPDGSSRFQYVYAVRSAQKDRRVWLQRALQPRPTGPTIEASRTESFVGVVRRQFVSVPVQPLPAGRYKLEVRVIDLVSRQEAERSVEFDRAPPAGP